MEYWRYVSEIQKLGENGEKNESRFSIFPVLVCGPFIPLVSTLGQSGPSMFWNMLKSNETRRVQSFGAMFGASAAKQLKNLFESPDAPLSNAV